MQESRAEMNERVHVTSCVGNVHNDDGAKRPFIKPATSNARKLHAGLVFLGAYGRRDEDNLSREQLTGKKSSAGNTELRPLILGPQ